jgi:putative ABC transport system permease protein
MFKSYFKIALRNLRKQKVYSLINVLGLAAGMACFIIISLYVLHEYSFDKFHEKSGCIYRIVAEHKWYDQFNRIAVTSGPLAPALVRDFPEVTKATRFGSLYPALVSYREQHFYVPAAEWESTRRTFPAFLSRHYHGNRPKVLW